MRLNIPRYELPIWLRHLDLCSARTGVDFRDRPGEFESTVRESNPRPVQPFTFSSKAAAAAVSASCFELPVALASASAPIEAFTVKRGAWCGPERSITS